MSSRDWILQRVHANQPDARPLPTIPAFERPPASSSFEAFVQALHAAEHETMTTLSAAEQALLARLQAMLPRHHLLLQLPAEHCGPLALFAHDAACNELLLSVLRGRDWDLIDWPGRQCDGPLYSLADAAELQRPGPYPRG